MPIHSQSPPTNAAKLAECQAKLAELESNSSAIEALKELHSTVFQRWQNRRDYEWKLSYAIWTALAAFIAVVIFGKDTQFGPITPLWIVLALIVFSILAYVHYRYLGQMIERVLDDLQFQYRIENTLDDLQFQYRKCDTFDDLQIQYRIEDTLDDLPEGKIFRGRQFNPKDSKHRYGLKSQVGITILLAFVALFSMWTRLNGATKNTDEHTKNPETFISNVGQGEDAFTIIVSGPVGAGHRHTFLLNRKTGQVWVMTCHGGSNVQFVKTSIESLNP